MGGGPSYPTPSKEERSAQQAQADLLKQYQGSLQTQLQQQNLLAPYIYKQLNLAPDYNDQGQLVGLSSLGDTPEQIAAKQQLQTATETSKAQLAAYNQQIKTQQLLQPYALRQLGYDPQYDEQGNLTGLTERPATVDPLDQQRRDLEGQFLTRTQQALQGQLPVDPALERQFSEQEAQLRAHLQQQLGPGYETSTPGIQALAQFNQRKAETLFGAQHGEIGSSAALALGTQQGNIAGTAADQRTLLGNLGAAQGVSGGVLNSSQLLSPYANLSPYASQGTTSAGISTLIGGVGAPYTGASGLGTLSQLYGQSLAPYSQQRQGEYGADLSRYGQQSALYGGIGAVLGGVAGGALSYGNPAAIAAGASLGGYAGRSFA